MTRGYNLPDNVSPSDKDAPWNQDEFTPEPEVLKPRTIYYSLHDVPKYFRELYTPNRSEIKLRTDIREALRECRLQWGLIETCCFEILKASLELEKEEAPTNQELDYLCQDLLHIAATMKMLAQKVTGE